jgi:hypothetical protein
MTAGQHGDDGIDLRQFLRHGDTTLADTADGAGRFRTDTRR